jgi:imidazolonepropionase-like amidohydrolase
MSLGRLLGCCVLVVAGLGAQSVDAPRSGATLFEGGRILTGAGGAPNEDGALLVENHRIVAAGRRRDLRTPPGTARVDLTGKTVMPAIVDAHVHLGYQRGLTFAAENFTRATLIDQLNRYAYAGISAVLSLGTDPGGLPLQLRADQAAGRVGGARYLFAGRGLGAPDGGPGTPELKASAYGVTTEEEARRAVREQIANHVDVIKVWVDDRNGTVPKLSPPLYRAIIDEAHAHQTPVVAHIFYLDDAKDLARAGVDGFAHLMRDKDVDAELVSLVTSRRIFVMPNLAISENGAHAEAPAWLDDALLQETAPPDVIARVRASFPGRSPAQVQRAAATYGGMQRSLAKLSAAGAVIGFGTDDGAVRDHFYAYTAHRELRLMVEAGMTPAAAIAAATRVSANFLRLRDLGTLEPGKRADFIVLDANPLDDIANTQKIAAVYLDGQKLDRAAMRAGFR